MAIDTILVATTNPGKVKELSAMLDIQCEWKYLRDFEGIIEVVEDGRAFSENASKKALEYAKQTGLWTIADDSGLMVDALDGEPGINSARFSGEKNSDKSLIDNKNIEKVLQLMENVPDNKRTARFICSLALASPEKILAETQGILSGQITRNKIGQNGFGYDPVFWVTEKNKTVAQMIDDEKNAISHRGVAIKKIKAMISKLIK
jgi:XTP/dITP diphosphohydrolase